jgi:hypothetical protein
LLGSLKPPSGVRRLASLAVSMGSLKPPSGVRRLASLAVLAMLLGCPSARIPRIPGDPPPVVRDTDAEAKYQEVLDRYTSSRGVFDGFDTKVMVRATWLSPTFVDARMQREALFKDWPKKLYDEKLEVERTRVSDATEFFFAVHANDYKFEDFGQPNTMWRLALVVGGDELPPVSIERLGRSNVEMRSYYSYMENFWVGYRIRFPKREFTKGEVFHFKMASALGLAELPYTAD